MFPTNYPTELCETIQAGRAILYETYCNFSFPAVKDDAVIPQWGKLQSNIPGQDGKTMIYYLGLLGITAFSVTGVIAAGRKGMDIFSIVLLGVVTALGGGTMRDVIIDTEIFWIADLHYLWVALLSSVATFFLIRYVTHAMRLLPFFDAFGLALFTVLATGKTLTLGFPAPVAVLMGLITGVAGGMYRDILTGRMSLMLGKEFYATPALLGAVLYAILAYFFPQHGWNRLYAIALIFALRGAAIQWNLYYPNWLTYREE